MASLTITESEVLTAIMSTDDETISRLVHSTEEVKVVVGKIAKQCFRELLNRHIILTHKNIQFIQKILIDSDSYPFDEKPDENDANALKMHRIKYTLYYMNEIAMHEGDPDELLWHNVQMAIVLAYKVQHGVMDILPWRKLINYLNLIRKQHLTETGIDVDLVPKLVAIVTCFHNALEKKLNSEQTHNEIQKVFEDEWINTFCDDYYWELKDKDTVNKMIESFKPLDKIKQVIKENGHISNMEFVSVLKVVHSIGKLCKNTYISPNMSKTLKNIFSRYVPDEIKRDLIDLCDIISDLDKYVRMWSKHEDLVMTVIQSLDLLADSILKVKQHLLNEEIAALQECMFTTNETVVFTDLLESIQKFYDNNRISCSFLKQKKVYDYLLWEMSILYKGEIFHNKTDHLLKIDYVPEVEIKLLLQNNHNIRRRHTTKLNTHNEYKQNQLHIATIGTNVTKVSELLSSGSLLDQNDIAGFCAMFYAIRSDSIKTVSTIYDSIKSQSTFNRIIEWLLWTIRVSNINAFDLVVEDILRYIKSDLSYISFCEARNVNLAEAIETLIKYETERSSNTLRSCSFPYVDLVKFLLRNVSDINAADYNGCTALHRASRHGHNIYVELLLNSNSDINVIDTNGWTALHWASYQGHDRCVELLLLKSNFFINTVTHSGRTALHLASYQGHDKCVELLLNHNSDVDAVDSDKRTALHHASNQGHDKCVELLLNNNADDSKATSNGSTALHLASYQGHHKCVELLLKNGSGNINKATPSGRTALFFASYAGHYKCIDLLLNNNAEINAVTCYHRTALHLASEHGYDKCVELLLEKGSDINIGDPNGFTALHHASNKGHDKCVAILLNKNADVNAIDSDRQTALHCASNQGHDKCIELLLNYKSDINAVTCYRWTALCFASKRGHDKCVELLLEKGPAINIVDSMRWTALHHASNQGHDNCVKLLLKNGSDINRVTYRKRTALELASEQGHDQCVKLLLTSNADINTFNYKGWTALHYALNQGSEKCVELLLLPILNIIVIDSIVSAALEDTRVSSKYHSVFTKMMIKIFELHLNMYNNKQKVIWLLLAIKYKNCDIVNQLLSDNSLYEDEEDELPEINMPGTVSKLVNWRKEKNAPTDKSTKRIIEILWKYGADINQQDTCGKTALYLACEHSDICIVSSLLSHNADLTISDTDGNKVLNVAKKDDTIFGIVFIYANSIDSYFT